MGPTAIAFATFAYALKHMEVGALAITTYLIPPLTIVLSLLVLSETPPVVAYVGGVLSLVGVAVAQRTGKAEPPTTSASGHREAERVDAELRGASLRRGKGR